MKKSLTVLFVVLSWILLVWCGREVNNTVQLWDIDNIINLQKEIDLISQDLIAWRITPQVAMELTEQLQKKYLEITEEQINEKTESIKKIINERIESAEITGLPEWAKKLGLTEPAWMELDTAVSKQTRQDNEWYDSVTLVYKWDYNIAMSQAKLISDGANIPVSKEFAQAQELMKQKWNIVKWIVYTNHGLLDTKIDYLEAVSVDQDWTLTIEVTNYQQMKDR